MQRILKAQRRIGPGLPRSGLADEATSCCRRSNMPNSACTSAQRRQFIGGCYRPTAATQLPMKPGHVFQGLDVYKDKDPPVVLERSEYPEWIGDLAKPLPSLAELRRMPEEEATDRDVMRFLKLERKIVIKAKNEASKGKRRVQK